MPWGVSRARALTALAVAAPESERGEILIEALHSIVLAFEEGEPADTLIDAISSLPEPVLTEILATAAVPPDRWVAVQALAALTPHLEPHDRRTVLKTVISAASGEELDLAPAIGNSQETIADTLSILGSPSGEFDYVREAVLIDLAPALTPDMMADALAVIRQIEDRSGRAQALGCDRPASAELADQRCAHASVVEIHQRMISRTAGAKTREPRQLVR